MYGLTTSICFAKHYITFLLHVKAKKMLIDMKKNYIKENLISHVFLFVEKGGYKIYKIIHVYCRSPNQMHTHELLHVFGSVISEVNLNPRNSIELGFVKGILQLT